MSELLGRTALVTGGGVRVGRAIAVELARGGADVVVHFHASAAGAGETVREITALGRRAVAVAGELASTEAVARVFAEADRLLAPPDILVNNAGIFERRPFEEISEAQLRGMLEVNLIAPFLCAQQAATRMRQAGRGDIVNILDVGGTSLAWKGYAHYCAAKAGLAMLTRVLSAELAPTIRVNGVAPGAVLFPEGEDEATRKRVLARVPLGRAGSAEDVARTVRFLIGGPAYVTGQIIAVDGGRSAAG